MVDAKNGVPTQTNLCRDALLRVHHIENQRGWGEVDYSRVTLTTPPVMPGPKAMVP